MANEILWKDIKAYIEENDLNDEDWNRVAGDIKMLSDVEKAKMEHDQASIYTDDYISTLVEKQMFDEDCVERFEAIIGRAKKE
jgi:metal-responsive CopG/Arc/MetJ family transcriptional regulator